MSRLSPFGLLAVALAFTGAAAASGEIYRWTDEKGVTHYSDKPPVRREHTTFKVAAAPPATPVAAAEPVVDAPQAPVTTNQSNCETARKNLETFANSTSVTMDRDGDGRAEPLDDAAVATEMARNEELVRIYCQ